MDIDPQHLKEQIDETIEDLKVFIDCRNKLRRRVVDVRDCPRPNALLPRIYEWSGTDCVLGGLDLCIHAMERTLDELGQLKKAAENGRRFRVIEGEYGSQE